MLVDFDNVAMRYGDGAPVFRDVSFTLEPNSFHFVYGESGSGKSSLLQLIYHLHKPTEGRVSVFGVDVAQASRRKISGIRRRLGVVFQDFRLIPHLSVQENVALSLRVTGVKESAIRPQVAELLEWIGLASQRDAAPDTLSGGQKQRVAIARAVITRPLLLLADEPTGNLDNRLAERLLYLFEELHRAGTTVVIATHNEDLVSRFSHPCLVIEGTRIHRVMPAQHGAESFDAPQYGSVAPTDAAPTDYGQG